MKFAFQHSINSQTLAFIPICGILLNILLALCTAIRRLRQGIYAVLYKHGTIRQDLFVVLIDFSITVMAATLIFISGRGSAIPSA